VVYPGRQIGGRHRAGNAKTLGQFAAQLQQQAAMGRSLHPFRDDAAFEGGCQA